jgi:hypothetical protein
MMIGLCATCKKETEQNYDLAQLCMQSMQRQRGERLQACRLIRVVSHQLSLNPEQVDTVHLNEFELVSADYLKRNLPSRIKAVQIRSTCFWFELVSNLSSVAGQVAVIYRGQVDWCWCMYYHGPVQTYKVLTWSLGTPIQAQLYLFQ